MEGSCSLGGALWVSLSTPSSMRACPSTTSKSETVSNEVSTTLDTWGPSSEMAGATHSISVALMKRAWTAAPPPNLHCSVPQSMKPVPFRVTVVPPKMCDVLGCTSIMLMFTKRDSQLSGSVQGAGQTRYCFGLTVLTVCLS